MNGLNTLRTAERPLFVRYAVAVGCIFLCLLARVSLSPLVGQAGLTFTLFFPAVTFAAWYGGWGPGLLSILLSAGATDWLFIEPVHSWSYNNSSDLASTATFVISASVIVIAMGTMQHANARALREIEARERAEAEQRTTLASIGDAVVVTDTNGMVTFLNAEAERLMGWSNVEARGQPLSAVFHIVNEKTRQLVENPVEKVLRLGTVVGLANHTLLLAKGGEETAIDDSAAPINTAGGPILGVVLVFRDVTAQRKAQQFAERLAAIVEHSGDAMLTKNLDGIVLSWNASAEKLFGYPADEIIGRPIATLFPDDRLNEEDPIIDRLREGMSVERFETVRVAKDGRHIHVAVSVSPLRDEDGDIVGASKTIYDITDLVAARESLAREKELFATTLASIGDAVVLTDPNGRITFLNAEAQRLTKWADADALGEPLPNVFRIINEETRHPVENPVEKVLRLGGVVGLANHTVLIAKDGSELPIDDSAAPIRLPDGPLFGVVLVFRDFTERKRAEDRLRQSQGQLSGLIDSAMDAIVAVDEGQHIVLFNPAAEQMFSCAAVEAVGSPLDRFIPNQYREVHRWHIRAFSETGVTSRGMGALGALSGLRSSGEEFPIEASISQMNVGGRRLFTVILRDITERNRVEGELREARQELLLHTEDLEATVAERTSKLQEKVDELQHVSYAISHDMRAPLRAMNTFATLMLHQLSAGIDLEQSGDYCRRIITASSRLDKLIQDALHYTKVVEQGTQVGPVDVSRLVRDLIRTYPNLHAEKAAITVENELPTVLGNEALLAQCFSNLLGNAAKFVAPGVRPEIRVWAEYHDDYVKIWVKDNGIGIPKNAQGRLFKMFQKLDSEYEGTGIGLAIVHKVVERMGGTIGVDSEPDAGSSFWVELPLAKGSEGERV